MKVSRIYPYPMVWPLPRPWSETMVSIPFRAQKTLQIRGFLGLERPFWDLVSQAPCPRGRGRPLFADYLLSFFSFFFARACFFRGFQGCQGRRGQKNSRREETWFKSHQRNNQIWNLHPHPPDCTRASQPQPLALESRPPATGLRTV